MKKLQLWFAIILTTSIAFAGCAGMDPAMKESILEALQAKRGMNLETITAGLKEALVIGTEKAVARASARGGYSANPKIRIPLPEELGKVKETLGKIGLSPIVTRFEDKMNEAAEHAAANAVPVFVDAIKSMTFQDAKAILKGEGSAAADYFRERTSDRLREIYAPIVKGRMEAVGAVRSYNDLMDRYNRIPFVPKPKFTLESYVTDHAIQGLFDMLADEERKIREDPAARTTELLRKVFRSR